MGVTNLNEEVNKCEKYMDLYILRWVDGGKIIAFYKFESSGFIFWTIGTRDGGNFHIWLDCYKGSVGTISKYVSNPSGLEKQVTNFIFEVMGNGTPSMPDIMPRPN